MLLKHFFVYDVLALNTYLLAGTNRDFGELTFPQLFKVNDWIVVIPVAALSLLLFYWLESVVL